MASDGITVWYWKLLKSVLVSYQLYGHRGSEEPASVNSIDLTWHTHSEWATGAGGYVHVPWVPDYRRWRVYDKIPYQVKQGAGDRGVTVENMEKSQHTDFNEDTANESASVACSNARLWKLDTQKEWRNTSWRIGDERSEKGSAGFMDSTENKWVGLNKAGVKGELLDCESREANIMWSYHEDWGNEGVAWRKR